MSKNEYGLLEIEEIKGILLCLIVAVVLILTIQLIILKLMFVCACVNCKSTLEKKYFI